MSHLKADEISDNGRVVEWGSQVMGKGSVSLRASDGDEFLTPLSGNFTMAILFYFLVIKCL